MSDLSLWKVPLQGGEPELVRREPTYRITISPDGSKYAFFPDETVCRVRSFEDAAFEKVLEFPAGTGLSTSRAAWTQDGSALIYAFEDKRPVSDLWKLSVSDGTAEKLTNYDSDQILDFAVSSDGDQFAVSRGGWNFDAVIANGLQAFKN